MKITCLASSSQANAYVVETNSATRLLIELGMEYSKLRKSLLLNNYTMMDMHAALVSHKHQDHCKCAKDVSKMIPVYASVPTLEFINGTQVVPMDEWKPYMVKQTKIIAFSIEHDAEGTFGFIIEDSGERLVFINDTKFVKYDFSQLPFDYVMIESNYVEDLIDMTDYRNKRTINSHMALGTTISTVKAMNLSRCKGIYLMHLSDGNSDEARMIRDVQAATGIPTYACQKHGGINE